MAEFNQAAYVADYQKRNLREFKLKLNRITEPELIAHLEAQKNIQGYLKDLIRRDIKK